MPTIYQMNLNDVRKECERQAARANRLEFDLRHVAEVLAEPYDNVIDLEIRVQQVVKWIKGELDKL